MNEARETITAALELYERWCELHGQKPTHLGFLTWWLERIEREADRRRRAMGRAAERMLGPDSLIGKEVVVRITP
jgi:hypothetical protein